MKETKTEEKELLIERTEDDGKKNLVFTISGKADLEGQIEKIP